MNITLITSGSKARSTPACVITRGMTQAITATMLTEGGANVSTTGVAAWELGITQNFLAATPLLAGTNAIVAAANVLTIALNGHTVEMGEFLDGKNTGHGFATLKGLDSHGVVVATYVWPVVLQNIGYDADTEAAHAVDGLFYTAAVVDAKFAAVGDDIPAATEGARGTIALATAAEAAAGTDPNKAITAATLGAALEDAIPVIPPIPADLSDLSDTTGILAGKVDKVTGKGLSDNNYTNTDAAKVATVNNATLETLSGADVTVAPWGRYYWSAAGTCTLTVSGFGATGLEYAALLLDVAEAATLSVSGASVAEDDAITSAGQYMVYLINQGGTVHFRVASFTEAA